MPRLPLVALTLCFAVQHVFSAEVEPATKAIFPGEHWEERSAAELQLDPARLDLLAQLLDGRGCVVRGGYVVKSWGSQSERGDWASSAKPVLSTLLFFALDEKKIDSVHARVVDLGWSLDQKDSTMTLAHLANMISGYARPEPPGAAFAYNDFAIQLYQRTLFDRIFQQDPDQVAATRFAPLELEDGLRFDKGRRRLSASVRDFARIAWFWRQKGQWKGNQIVSRSLFDEYQRPHVPLDLPMSVKADTNDYLKVGTYGGGSHHFTQAGPGIYGFNWWFNRRLPGQTGTRTWPDAPDDTLMSIGAQGNCSVVIPSLDLVLVAADANWGEFAPGDLQSPLNRVIRLLVEAAGKHSTPPASAKISGEPRTWHNITLSFNGPQTSESASPNPFRDYRLTVQFANFMRTVTVSGYFAADGDAAETGAESGNCWRVHFSPDAPGVWTYHASFVRGPDVAIDLEPNAGIPLAPDGACGTFRVERTDKQPPDLRGKGRLRAVGERYFVFAEADQPYIKGGADSPENFLAFADFDGTTPTHHFAPHERDSLPTDPTWRGGRGKNIFGALNYLAGHRVNCLYFLTMNVRGDGDDVWPWPSQDERFRFDASKLAQWELVFSHMDRLGIMLHVVHQEQENDQLLDHGELGPERKLYYRELIARFAHHPALVWNLGEENTNTTSQLKAFSRYIDRLDPYGHPIVVHTFPSQYDKVYEPLLGDRHIAGASLQVGNMERAAKVTRTWLERSAASGHPWAVFLDEIGPADTGVKPDSDDPQHDDVRRHALWAPLMCGGSGAEWLFGYKYAHHDTNLEDFRSRDRMWKLTRIAVEFFEKHVPVRKTVPSAELVSHKAFCLAQPGQVYALYLPDGGGADLKLEAGQYRVRWYDPRRGGELEAGSVAMITGPGKQSIGTPPSEVESDWAVLVTRMAAGNSPSEAARDQ